MKIQNIIHSDLLAAQKLAYEPSGFTCKNLVQEKESREYGAFQFEMNNRRIKFRIGKVTPKKDGHFVTLWKRFNNGPILPFDLSDPVDLFVVSVCDDKYLGQFVFSKEVLCEKGFVSKEKKGGKRAMRVYPPWVITANPKAKKTQVWQLMHYLEIQPKIDIDNLQRLFH